MEEILGYRPDTSLRLRIMADAREKGIPLGEATALYAMPDILIQGEDGLYETDLGRMSIEEYRLKVNPWKKYVIIKYDD